MTNIEHYRSLTEVLFVTYKNKNEDYGDAFGKTCEMLGKLATGYQLGVLNAKVSRITTLLTNDYKKENYESLEDSLLDLASYAIMTIIERRKNHESIR